MLRKILPITATAAFVAVTAFIPAATVSAAVNDPAFGSYGGVDSTDLNADGQQTNKREGAITAAGKGTLPVTILGGGSDLLAFSLANSSEFGTGLPNTAAGFSHQSGIQAYLEFAFGASVSDVDVFFKDVQWYQSASTPSGYTITAGNGESVACTIGSGLVGTTLSNNVWTLHTSAPPVSGKVSCSGAFTKLKFTPTGYTMQNVGPTTWWGAFTVAVDTTSLPDSTPPPQTTQPTDPSSGDSTPVAPAYTG